MRTERYMFLDKYGNDIDVTEKIQSYLDKIASLEHELEKLREHSVEKELELKKKTVEKPKEKVVKNFE